MHSDVLVCNNVCVVVCVYVGKDVCVVMCVCDDVCVVMYVCSRFV